MFVLKQLWQKKKKKKKKGKNKRQSSQNIPSAIVLTLGNKVVLCESRGRRPGLPVPKSPSGPCGRKATLNLDKQQQYQQPWNNANKRDFPAAPFI